MSKTIETTARKKDVPKKTGCCGGDHDRDSKHQAAPAVAPDHAKPSKQGTQEHAAHPHDGAGCCGGGKTRK